MSNYHCYLCASDDGIQLDIFGVGGKAICEKIESCLSVKIEESNAISTKICHKCAFELDACYKFVAKYRQARDSKKGKSNPVKGHCSLCSEPGKIGYIFDCKVGNPANETLHKIQEIFNDSIFNDKRRTLSICLDCRYNLDVLFDLKSIYQSTPDKLRRLREESLELSELPKTKTRVVNRKTTYIPVSRLNSTEAYDTDSSSVTSIMSYKRKRGPPRKGSEPTSPGIFRTCEKCEASVENGLDMYRYHRTGITVCKDCWLAMDPEKVTHNKRKKLGLASGDVGTRRCAIILKDVLTNPAKYENIYKVEKDVHGNTTFIVTDDSSESEEREKTPAKRSRRSRGSVASSVDHTPVKRGRPFKRTASTKSTDLDDEPPAKIRDKGKNTVADVIPAKTKDKVKKTDVEKPSTSTKSRARNGLATSDTEVFESRTRRRLVGQSADSEKNAKAASDAELTKPPAKKRSPRVRLEKNEPADSSSNETKTAVTTKGRKAAKNAAPVVSTTDPVERPVRRTRAHTLPTQDAILLSNRISKVLKSVSEAESSPTKIRRTKIKSLSPKNSASELEVENPYTCSVCHVEYRNKLIGMKHELTHAKQPEVKLQRVAIPEIIVEEAPAESSLIEEPEEQSHDVSSTSENRPGDSESVETAVPVASHDEASIDVLANENKENFEKSKSLSESDETAAKIDDKEEVAEDKMKDKTDEIADRIEDKAGENTNKVEDKVDETINKTEYKTEETEDKTEDKTDEIKDKTESKTDEIKDKTENKKDEIEDKTENTKDETEDKTENKKDEIEDKTENKKDETEDKTENTTDDIEDKIENTKDDTEDRTENEKDETEDRTENKKDETEDRTENKKDETEDKTETKKDETDNKMDETEDKIEHKKNETVDEIDNKMDETEDKIEEKTDAPEIAEAETTVVNKNCDENNIENTRQAEKNDTLRIAESDKNNEDEETEITDGKAADSKTPESTLSEEVEKEVESAKPLEMSSEQVLNKAEETSENLNGVNVDDETNSEVNNSNGVEKDAVALDCDAESKTVDDCTREKSVEPDNVPSVTSTAPEKDNEVQDVVKDKVSSDDDDTTKDLEGDAETATTEGSIAPENNATKDGEESESIVSDVLTEVFDLATAEVQKRMENEPSRDEKCTTPVSETLENISREISNSADMPSLEPLVDNQSSNIQS